MTELRYIEDVNTLKFAEERCNGCRECVAVCPHGVFEMNGKAARVVDRGACMECGACSVNCAAGAIELDPGVGCAAAIINSWITGGEPSCDC